jgi:hypothetical protein
MRVNSESVSNEIDESELQYEKQSEQSIRTWRGIVIDLREKQEKNALIRYASIQNLSQMKSKKGISNWKN